MKWYSPFNDDNSVRWVPYIVYVVFASTVLFPLCVCILARILRWVMSCAC